MKVSTILPSDAKQAILMNDMSLLSSVRLSKGKVYGSKGKTVLHYVAKYCDDSQVASYCINKLKVNPSALSKKGKTSSLHVACKYGRISLVRFLLELPINRDMQDLEGETALSQAIKHDQTDVALLLINSGAQAGLKNKIGWTPLHWASKKGNLIVTTLLVQMGQNPSLLTKLNETCLHLAVESGCIYTVEALIKLVSPVQLSNKGTLIHHSANLPDVTDYLLTNTCWKDFPKLGLLLDINAPVNIFFKHASNELVVQALDVILRFDRADLLQEMSARHFIDEKVIQQLASRKVFTKC
jgi:ankyrin repeat protein